MDNDQSKDRGNDERHVQVKHLNFARVRFGEHQKTNAKFKFSKGGHHFKPVARKAWVGR